MKKISHVLIAALLFCSAEQHAQYSLRISDNYNPDLSVRFTDSYNADLDVRFVNSENQADFTVGFTNTKSKATIALTTGYNSDLRVKITDSYNADVDIRIYDSYNADIDIFIKNSGYVDYLIYTEDYLDKNEIIVACLPIIKAISNNNSLSKVSEIPLYFEDCGTIIKPDYETQVSGSFEGFDWEDKVYELLNGLYISSNQYSYDYCYFPNIKLYYCNKWYASIDCHQNGKLVEVNVYR